MTMPDELVARLRAVLADVHPLREVRMFGGIGFMLNGNLLAAASRRGLLLRVGREHQDESVAKLGARPMVMRGRTMPDYVYLDPPPQGEAALRQALSLAIAFVRTLPTKAPGGQRAPKKGNKA